MKTMIVDSHQHVMLPTSMQVKKMDDAGVDKAILFTTTPHVERAASATLAAGVSNDILRYPLCCCLFGKAQRNRAKTVEPIWRSLDSLIQLQNSVFHF